MRRQTVLLLWLYGLLFPITGLRERYPAFRLWFDGLFEPEWLHIVSHLILFSGLVVLVVYAFRMPLNRRTVAAVLMVILGVGMVQEGLQLLFKQRPFGWTEVFDFGVDLLGGMLGLGLVWLASRLRKRAGGETA